MAAELTLDVLAERLAALDARVTMLGIALDRLDQHSDTFVTKSEVATFADQSRADREQLHDQLGELRVNQKSFMGRSEADAAQEALRSQLNYLQGAVNRMLIGVLTSLVLALVTALIFDLTHQ